ncbi:DUF1476 domain-containing protein [Zavarzinia compransoris]|uniref:DUF1476 domain-containing protein n=1 Tax=Zavarzinia compransoris TaxID=1264899 RepID=A0A317E919_9PROT|nr:DUF1476 domain-containing protein [Zavarzinia compransoris]PWR23617.1 DUF1476 domain-containing protein [Zavarzinia compransoris]TDP47835.1 hypothetical protein DES42_102131 [Zavarzinia compransoris]
MSMNDREKAFEAKFAHDEEKRFRAVARRNKLLGYWAAEKLGLSGDAAESYAKDVVVADFVEAGDEDVIRKVLADFQAKGLDLTDRHIRLEIESLSAKVLAELE